MPRQFNVKKAVFTAEETAKWKEINAAVAGNKKVDPKAAVKRFDTALASIANKENQAPDEIDSKDKDYVGIVLGGYSSGEAMVDGSLETGTDDVYVEEPRVVADDDDDADADERSLWGDGDDDPAEEA
eukprot:TRINITY_DN50_c0_g1_i3.p2 TRINITY_DN50_c0_g1~~TRINITY_DN50_c0_g1_i3.p2  ORF type:complete len:128 (-),score=59.34 TRINITY_DN50_c0_g1_i3:129-512(-)